MIKTWIIDLGPEAWPGLDLGAATAAGKSSQRGRRRILSAAKRSYTGAFLKPVLARRGPAPKKKRVEAAE